MEINTNHIQVANSLLQEQILEQLPTPVMAVDKELRIIYMNAAGKTFVNKQWSDIQGKYCYDLMNSAHCRTSECCMVKAIESGNTCSARNTVPLNNEELSIEYYAVPLKDANNEVIGGLEFILDITERVMYEDRLRQQSHTIRQMSTPTIKLWEDVLVLPVVGIVDSMRAQHMMESMLQKIAETYAKVIILDIQGVAAVDTAVANHLIKITKATKLMGCNCILSGISPAVAQTIIQLGIDMDAINTRATLSDALAEAFHILQVEVVKKDSRNDSR